MDHGAVVATSCNSSLCFCLSVMTDSCHVTGLPCHTMHCQAGKAPSLEWLIECVTCLTRYMYYGIVRLPQYFAGWMVDATIHIQCTWLYMHMTVHCTVSETYRTTRVSADVWRCMWRTLSNTLWRTTAYQISFSSHEICEWPAWWWLSGASPSIARKISYPEYEEGWQIQCETTSHILRVTLYVCDRRQHLQLCSTFPRLHCDPAQLQ